MVDGQQWRVSFLINSFFSLSNGTLERVLLHTWCWAVSGRWVKPPSSHRNQSFDLSQNSGHDWSVEVKKREMFLLSYCFLQFRNQNLKQSPTFKGDWEATVEMVTITHYWNQRASALIKNKFCLNVPKTAIVSDVKNTECLMYFQRQLCVRNRKKCTSLFTHKHPFQWVLNCWD